MRDTLIAARKLIAEQGWTRQSYTNQEGSWDEFIRRKVPLKPHACFCTAGAVMYAAQSWHPDAIMHALVQELPEHERRGTSPYDIVFNWNDAPERTKDDVLTLFDKAIANVQD